MPTAKKFDWKFGAKNSLDRNLMIASIAVAAIVVLIGIEWLVSGKGLLGQKKQEQETAEV